MRVLVPVVALRHDLLPLPALDQLVSGDTGRRGSRSTTLLQGGAGGLSVTLR